MQTVLAKKWGKGGGGVYEVHAVDRVALHEVWKPHCLLRLLRLIFVSRLRHHLHALWQYCIFLQWQYIKFMHFYY